MADHSRLALAAMALALCASSAHALELKLGPVSVGIANPQGLVTAAIHTDGVRADVAIGGNGAVTAVSAQAPVASASASASITGIGLSAGTGVGGTARVNLALGTPPPAPPPDNGSGSGIGDGFGFQTYGIRGLNGVPESRIALALANAYGGLASGDQMLLRSQCGSVLANPAAFEASLVALCRMIARMRMTN